ncbi:uncharacterized protein LOC143462898 [Clavelina lepadiformis]|uniref:uncharacterized protein LOC143462898 n=1 Tax=Clavelina lepadiformis TaxID=159417 RepID=UPI004041B148
MGLRHSKAKSFSDRGSRYRKERPDPEGNSSTTLPLEEKSCRKSEQNRCSFQHCRNQLRVQLPDKFNDNKSVRDSDLNGSQKSQLARACFNERICLANHSKQLQEDDWTYTLSRKDDDKISEHEQIFQLLSSIRAHLEENFSKFDAYKKITIRVSVTPELAPSVSAENKQNKFGQGIDCKSVDNEVETHYKREPNCKSLCRPTFDESTQCHVIQENKKRRMYYHQIPGSENKSCHKESGNISKRDYQPQCIKPCGQKSQSTRKRKTSRRHIYCCCERDKKCSSLLEQRFQEAMYLRLVELQRNISHIRSVADNDDISKKISLTDVDEDCNFKSRIDNTSDSEYSGDETNCVVERSFTKSQGSRMFDPLTRQDMDNIAQKFHIRTKKERVNAESLCLDDLTLVNNSTVNTTRCYHDRTEYQKIKKPSRKKDDRSSKTNHSYPNPTLNEIDGGHTQYSKVMNCAHCNRCRFSKHHVSFQHLSHEHTHHHYYHKAVVYTK